MNAERASELWADQTSLKLTETVLNHLKKKLWNVCHVSDVSLSGWLSIGLGLRQRNPPPRAGREGPQGSKPNQLPPPPTHRQARTADILPSLNHWQWEIWKGNRWRGRVVASRWSVFSVVIGVVVFFMAVCVYGVVSSVTTLTSVGSCFVASGTELVIMLIWNVTQRQCAFTCA